MKTQVIFERDELVEALPACTKRNSDSLRYKILLEKKTPERSWSKK